MKLSTLMHVVSYLVVVVSMESSIFTITVLGVANPTITKPAAEMQIVAKMGAASLG